MWPFYDLAIHRKPTKNFLDLTTATKLALTTLNSPTPHMHDAHTVHTELNHLDWPTDVSPCVSCTHLPSVGFCLYTGLGCAIYAARVAYSRHNTHITLTMKERLPGVAECLHYCLKESHMLCQHDAWTCGQLNF